MIRKRLAGIGAASLLAVACLYGQGLNTKATAHDWEEINFEFNSSILSDGYPSLLRLAELLGQHRDYRVKVTGHTDSVGSARYNEKLAAARANMVRDFLLKYGASAQQVSAEAEGKRNPEVSNRSKEGRFMNRRVNLIVTDGQGKVVGDGGVSEAIHGFDELLKKQEECCNAILKRLDKLDDILAAVRDLKGENDRLKSELSDLRSRVDNLPKPLSAAETKQIADKSGEEAGQKTLEEAARRNKKFSLLGLNVGPTYGQGRTGDFTLSGRGQFFSPFGGSGTHAVQAQGEYMYYPGRQEGQFDLGLVNRWGKVQAGAFGSFKYIDISQYQHGGSLAQGAFTLDYIFGRGKLGVFGTKGFKNEAVLSQTQLGPGSVLETYARLINQVGVSTQIGLFGNSYVEGNIGYLQSHGQADRPGGMLRYVHPLSSEFALTMEAGLNETYLNTKNSGRVVFGFQFGNFMRPKEFADTKSPVPVDIPRIRYEILTRKVGHSAPVADAGPDQIGVPAGQVTLDGSASYSPDGDALTYAWTQLSGPAVGLSGANTVKATFDAATGQTYSFRLVVRNPYGQQAAARVTVSTTGTSTLHITNFTASPSTIVSGARSTLTWQVENAQQVSISPSVGTVDSKSGSTDVNPTQTTQYTLTATNGGKSISATVTVTVEASAPQILRFEGTPTQITLGQSSTLSWTTQGAKTVQISGIGTVPASGSQTVSPTDPTTTYTLTAIGADGTQVTAPVVITVLNATTPQISQFAPSPSAIPVGGSAQLCWTVQNATTVTITPGIGTVKASDCATVNPTATTTYVLTATNAKGTSTANAILTVGSVKILSFTSDPETSHAAGAPVVLSWTTDSATSVTITGNGVPAGNLPLNGSITVYPTTNSTYTLTAYGAGGLSTTSVLSVFVR